MSRASKFEALWNAEHLSLDTNDDVITETREYELITPMFGGGSETQKYDPVTIVRATSVRGHLRFWWRATQAGRFSSIEDMRKHENELWGAASTDTQKTPSQVQIAVRVTEPEKIRPFQATNHRGNVVPIGDVSSDYSYAAFPLREENGNVYEGIRFTLEINYPSDSDKYKAEIEAALWAWETFGGIGARTRRGLGALHRIDGASISTVGAKERLHAQIKTHVVSKNSLVDVPTISNDPEFLFVDTYKNADDAWYYLLKKMKDFRQMRHPDSNGRNYGRSKWPEPDAIRREMNTHSRGHEPQAPHIDKFPRAAFGLPIIFKFKDGDQRNGDPQPTTLQGKNTTRMASPLIMRPYQCKDGCVAIVLRLNVPTLPPDGILLNDTHVDGEVNRNEAQQIEPLGGEPDVLNAFMNYLRR